MEIRLDKLCLENFKGIRDFTFSPKGQNITIRGANGTGKTTLADGPRWLLFGTDTQGKSDFAIKTLDDAGVEIPAIDHTVEADLQIDGQRVNLKKIYKEKWTKRRGEAQKTLTSHTTDHFIDGVPLQKKAWDEKIGELINEEIFKLITSPIHFNSLHWEKRREILLRICGDISDADVIASSDELEALPHILGANNLEDQRKIIKGKKKAINDRLREIPPRIDELNKSLPDTLPDKNAIQSQINLITQKIQDAKDDTDAAKLRKELADTKATIAEKRGEHQQKTQAANAEIEGRILDYRTTISRIKSDISTLEFKLSSARSGMNTNDLAMDKLRTEYTEIAAQSAPDEDTCPNCKQPLPSDQIEAARAMFRANQAAKLTEINARGKTLKYDNGKFEQLIKEGETQKERLNTEIDGLERKIETLQGKITIPGTPKEIQELESHVKFLETTIAERPTTDTSEFEAQLKEEQEKAAAIKTAEATKTRIQSLKNEEKQLSAEFEELERQLFLMEKFTVQKVSLLEFNINSKFKLARFKMFRTLINGGIEECCETLYNGVPYGPGLSTGERIMIGCDIIASLQEHYGIEAPVWIDHAESITLPIELDCQVIKLFVDEDCNILTVE